MNLINAQIKSLNLADIVRQSGVELKRQGRNLVGLCPNHQEKTPSFTVFGDRFKCFGCGVYGNAVDYVRLLHGFDFKEALKFLGIDRQPLSNEDYRAIERLKRERLRADKQKKRERDLAYTVAFLIRSAYKALSQITPDSISVHYF